MANEKVQAKVNEARKQAVELFASMVEKKGLNWLCEWDGTAFQPRNGVLDRAYHGGNRFHLMISAMLKGFTDNRWYTFKQAKEIGYHPVKGSKASIVEYWKMVSFMKDANGDCTDDVEDAVKRVSYPKLVSYYMVFNAQQLVDENGDPMPADDKITLYEHVGDLCEIADTLINSSRCRIDESQMNAEAFYRPWGDVIYIPSRVLFKDMESFLTVLAHEMTHSTMKPLDREAGRGNAFGSEAYAYEELVAELGSTFTLMALGVHRTAELESDKHFESHAAYLQSWLKAIKDDPDALFKAAADADKAADYLIAAYSKALGADAA